MTDTFTSAMFADDGLSFSGNGLMFNYRDSGICLDVRSASSVNESVETAVSAYALLQSPDRSRSNAFTELAGTLFLLLR